MESLEEQEGGPPVAALIGQRCTCKPGYAGGDWNANSDSYNKCEPIECSHESTSYIGRKCDCQDDSHERSRRTPVPSHNIGKQCVCKAGLRGGKWNESSQHYAECTPREVRAQHFASGDPVSKMDIATLSARDDWCTPGYEKIGDGSFVRYESAHSWASQSWAPDATAELVAHWTFRGDTGRFMCVYKPPSVEYQSQLVGISADQFSSRTSPIQIAYRDTIAAEINKNNVTAQPLNRDHVTLTNIRNAASRRLLGKYLEPELFSDAAEPLSPEMHTAWLACSWACSLE